MTRGALSLQRAGGGVEEGGVGIREARAGVAPSLSAGEELLTASARRPGATSRRPLLAASLVVPVLLTALAGGARAWRVTTPEGTYWDENWYAFDALAYLGGWQSTGEPGDPAVKIDAETTWVHPPLGKWIIALGGVGPLGFRPIGWRLPSVIFGTAGVLLLYLLALELWRSVWWAALAGLLLALDGLHLVQSRIAMLDIFVTTFLVAALLCLVRDRSRTPTRRAGEGPVSRWFGSGYRLGAGALLGAAVATKWSGLFGLALAAALYTAWTIRPASGEDRRRALRQGVASLVAVPLLVYLASYGAFFVEHGPDFGGFLALQVSMLQHQLGAHATQPGISSPWTWPLLLRPVRYYPAAFAHVPPGQPQVLALGNPVLWWGFLALSPVLVVRALRRGDTIARFILAGYGAMYLPWFASSRTEFLTYMLPAVPFMCLGVVAGVRSISGRWAGVGGGATAVAVGVSALAYAPLWLAVTAPAWWFRVVPVLPGWR